MGSPAPRPRIRIIGKLNGVGLSRSAQLLQAGLEAADCDVQMLECDSRERKRRRAPWWPLIARWHRSHRPTQVDWDLSVMLEHVWPQFLHRGARTVLVPHPEWFDTRDRRFLRYVDQVWALTGHADQIFRALGVPVRLIGFDSVDRYEPAVVREARFLHVAGRSMMKGTDRLLALWGRHPEWPLLTVVRDAKAGRSAPSGANVRLLTEYLDDSELRRLQNAHRFHLCPSEAEGWGHYIVEALSVGAIVVTVDAAPMNELVRPERGVLVSARPAGMQNLTRLVQFDEGAFEQGISSLLAGGQGLWDRLGAGARAWYLSNQQQFRERLAQAAREITAAPTRGR